MMTNEEAQIVIGNIPIKPEVLDDCYDVTEYQEAKAMAIKALAQESITWIVGTDNCQVAVRNMPIDKMQKICAIIGEEEPPQPNRCDNCIHSEEQDGLNCYECVKGIADNFEAQPTDADCISRAYIEPIVEELENICINGDDHILSLLSNIKNAPPVTPQPKIGRWNRVIDKAGHWVWECDKCGWQQRLNTNYCPDCGTKMEVEE